MNSVARFWILRTLAILVFASGGFCLFVALLNGWAWFDPALKFSIYTFGPLSVNLNTLVGGRGKVPEAAFQVLSYAATVILFFIGRWLWRLAGEPKADQPPSPEALDRSRKELMGVVRNVWIDNRLRNSIHNSVPMHPDKALSQEPVDYKLDLTVRSATEQEHLLPDNERLIDVYGRASGRLLILGAPGAGKTTTLLQLTEQLLDRAKDPTEPFPVVFTLSSWQGQEFDEWLIGQLGAWYDIDKTTASWWLDERKIILMLDGLDEVQPETQQKACLEALNKFRSESHLKVVLTSRIKDYQWLDTKLDAELALELKPLSPAKIDNYLGALGTDGALLRKAFQKEPELKTLAETPFLLNIMAMSVSELVPKLETERVGTLTAAVLDSFIVTRLKQSSSLRVGYSPPDTVRYLKLIAKNIRKDYFGGVMMPDLAGWLQGESTTLNQYYARAKSGLANRNIGTVLALILIAMGILVAAMLFVRYFGSHTLEQVVNEFHMNWSDVLFSFIDSLVGLLVLVVAMLVAAAISILIYKFLWARRGRVLRRAGLDKSTRSAWEPLFVQVSVTGGAIFIGVAILLLSFLNYATRRQFAVEQPSFVIPVVVFMFGFLYVFAFGLDTAFLLALQHMTPWNIRRFLRDCVKLKLMYKVGPGYVFIHRLLLDHFAELDIDRLHLEDLEKPRT